MFFCFTYCNSDIDNIESMPFNMFFSTQHDCIYNFLFGIYNCFIEDLCDVFSPQVF